VAPRPKLPEHPEVRGVPLGQKAGLGTALTTRPLAFGTLTWQGMTLPSHNDLNQPVR
jgi:hypothetical protein